MNFRCVLSLCVALALPSEGFARALVRAPSLGRSSLAAPMVSLPLAPSLTHQSISLAPTLQTTLPTLEAAAIPVRQAVAAEKKEKRPLVVRESLAVVEQQAKKAPAKTMRRFFDSGPTSRGSVPVLGSFHPRKGSLNAASHPQTVTRIETPPPSKEEGTGPVKKKRTWFKTGVLLGAAAVSAAGIAYSSVPPGLALNSLVSIGAAVGTLWAGHRIVRWALRRGPPKQRSLRSGVAIGLLLASFNLAYPQALMHAQFQTADAVRWTWEKTAPESWRGGGVDTALEVATETRDVESLPTSFANSVAEIVAQNPEGRKVLEKLRDRGGKLRLPDFYVAEVGAGTGARYIALYEGVYINPSYLKSAGVTLEEVRKDPKAAAKLIRHIEVTLFHELHHASQFRRNLLVPGMLEKFPSQLYKVLSLQTEYQTHTTEQRYVHEKLKVDPSAEMKYYEVREYEHFLDDYEAFLRGIDNAHAYRWFADIDSKYYEEFLAGERSVHDERAVEGYLNLARRAIAEKSTRQADKYYQKAVDRAERAGLPTPEKPF